VKRGEHAAPFSGEEGVVLPEEEDGQPTDRAGPPISEGEVAGQAGP
jgi:hypothetical protein